MFMVAPAARAMGRPTTGHLREIHSRVTGKVVAYSARVTYNGQRRTVPLEATTREMALREMTRMVDEQRRGIWLEPLPMRLRRSPRFDKFAEEWFARQRLEGGRYRTGLSPSGEADLRWRLDHLRAHFALVPINAITIADVDNYRLTKVQEGALNATSINKTIVTLAAILDTAVEYELINRNPAKGRRRRLAAVKPHRSWLDRSEQITALLDAVYEIDRETRLRIGQRRALIATFVFAGLRLGEALALRWEDVDLEAGTIRVCEAKTDAGVRTVNLLPVLRNELVVYKATLDESGSALLFGTRNGRPWAPSNVRLRILAPATQRASTQLEGEGLAPLPPGITPHSLRRTFASLLFALGESPPYVMNQIGHTTAGLTLALYARDMNRRDGERDRLRALVEGIPRKNETRRHSTSTAGRVVLVRPSWPEQPR
jgi:integrase